VSRNNGIGGKEGKLLAHYCKKRSLDKPYDSDNHSIQLYVGRERVTLCTLCGDSVNRRYLLKLA